MASCDQDSWQFKSLRGEEGKPKHPLFHLYVHLKEVLKLKGNPPEKPNKWKKEIVAALHVWASKEWLQALKAHPKLALYAQYRENLPSPFFAHLPKFQGRTTLVKARINDLSFYSTRLKGKGCPYCHAPLPDAGAEQDETEAMLHIFVACTGIHHPRDRFLASATWLPLTGLQWTQNLA